MQQVDPLWRLKHGGQMENKMQTEISDFTDIVGGFGPWQRTIFICLVFGAFPIAWHHLGIGFHSFYTDHWCARTPAYQNLTVEEWKNWSIPKDNSESPTSPRHCRMYDHNNNLYLDPAFNHSVAHTVPCSSWEFNTSFYRRTIITEWNLVCEEAWLVSLSQSVYMAGFLTAVFLFGQLSDRYGRRPIILLCLAMFVLAGLITAFSTSYIMFTVTRFFVAMGGSGLYTTGFVMFIEAIGAKYRSTLGIAIGFGWSTGFCLLPGIAWLIRDWFYLQLAITVPCIFLIVYYWLIPESPRWLLSQGRLEEALEVLHKACKQNGKEVVDLEKKVKILCNRAEKEREKSKVQRATIIDLLRTPNMRKKTLNVYFNWFVNSFVYYGLSLNTGGLGGNPFLNFFIAGITEYPAIIMSLIVIKHVGRRIPLMAMMIGGGIACVATIPIPESVLWLRITLAMIGKFCISSSFGIVYVYSAEIFPTVARNVGVGTSSMCARVGSIVAPFMKELGKASHMGVPLGIMGGFSVISGLLVLLLPETNNKKVPETLEDAERFGKSPEPTPSVAGTVFPSTITMSDDVIFTKVGPRIS